MRLPVTEQARRCLESHDGELKARDIAERTGLTNHQAAQALRHLLRLGIVDRRRDYLARLRNVGEWSYSYRRAEESQTVSVSASPACSSIVSTGVGGGTS
jgi:predicted transcriptional regulator